MAIDEYSPFLSVFKVYFFPVDWSLNSTLAPTIGCSFSSLALPSNLANPDWAIATCESIIIAISALKSLLFIKTSKSLPAANIRLHIKAQQFRSDSRKIKYSDEDSRNPAAQ